MKKLITAIRFLFRERLKINSDVIETKISDYHFIINRQMAENFREVISYDKVHRKQKLNAKPESIPPLYLTKISWHIVENLNSFLEQPIEPKLLKMLIHLSNHFEFFSELEYDRNYSVKSHLSLIEPHRKGTRLTICFEYYQQNNLVAVEYTTGLLLGVECVGAGREFGQRPKTIHHDEQLIWSHKLPVDKSLPYDYAKKAEIDAPIHTDPSFAKSIGLPDIILQGTCTFAKAVDLILTNYLQMPEANNNRSVKRLSANFTGILVAPNEMTIRVVFRSEKKIVFDVLDNKGKAVIKGGNIIL